MVSKPLTKQVFFSKSMIIGVGRFRILGGGGGGQGLEYRGGGGGQGGPNSQQAHDVVCNKSVPNNYISHLKI